MRQRVGAGRSSERSAGARRTDRLQKTKGAPRDAPRLAPCRDNLQGLVTKPTVKPHFVPHFSAAQLTKSSPSVFVLMTPMQSMTAQSFDSVYI